MQIQMCARRIEATQKLPNHFDHSNHAGAASKATIRCMSLEDSSVQAARQAVTSVLRSSQTPALQLAGSFDQYLHLLANDADALLTKFAQQTEPPAVDEYEAHLTKCQDAAEAIK